MFLFFLFIWKFPAYNAPCFLLLKIDEFILMQ